MLKLPADFSQKVFEHIQQLAGFGPREAGSHNEAKAFAYTSKQFRDLGIPTTAEPFEYESFKLEGIDLKIGGKPYRPTLIGFNPYAGVHQFAGQITLLDPQCPSKNGSGRTLKDAVIVASDPENYFRLIMSRPRLVLYLDHTAYSELIARENRDFTLRIRGSATRHQSANLVAYIGPRTGGTEEIILSAHIDSYADSPGADDNASGIGVLIELARSLKSLGNKLPCQLKLIAFGAEELGILGSRVYVNRHPDKIKHCALILNLDQVGGGIGPNIELLGGVVGMPPSKGQSQIPMCCRERALDGQKEGWRMVMTPDMITAATASNHPEWLVEIIQDSAAELGMDITPCGNLGSDQQAFAQAGVPATGIGFSGTEIHTPNDTPDQIIKTSLEKAGRIAAAVVLKTMQRLEVLP
jgi:hypothetical protein